MLGSRVELTSPGSQAARLPGCEARANWWGRRWLRARHATLAGRLSPSAAEQRPPGQLGDVLRGNPLAVRSSLARPPAWLPFRQTYTLPSV